MPIDKALIEKLKRREEQTEAGAYSLTPKQQMLDKRELAESMPDYRIRWVNITDPMKIESRKTDGYTIIPSEEGGARLGEQLVLMRLPRDRYQARVDAQDKMNRDRLKQHQSDMARVAEGVARELRNKYGIDVDAERILVQEG